MSLTKEVSRARCRCSIISTIRKLNTEANADRPVTSRFPIHLRNMSVNQWKIVSQIKEQLSEKGPIMHVVRREWVDLVKRMPFLNGQFNAQDKNTKATNNEASRLGQTLFESLQVITDLKAKLSQNSPSPPPKALIESKWKRKPKAISAESIVSRTNYLISSLNITTSDESLVKRLEDLTNHLLEYPDAANLAVKGGAVHVLLKIRSVSKREDVLEGTQGALAMVGYADPPDGRGIRVLSIDGGGVRGLLVIEMLRRLEELSGKKIHQMFDYICGVSTGSILAATIGASGKSLEEIAHLYKLLSTKIFTQSAFEGARSLLWNHGYYDTAMWEKMLQDNIGQATFYESARKRWCPKIGVVSTVVHQGEVVPFIFRNYEHPYRVRSQYIGSNRHKLWEAARASAAAPAYFGEFLLDNFLHQDGGMLVNNPTAVALHEAKLLWPRHDIQCVISCGTGRVNPNVGLHREDTDLSKQASWKEKFTQILVSATDTEGVHTILSDLLPSSRYFRFNPYLTEMLSMVEYQPEKLALLEQDAAMYIRRNDEKFAEAADILMEKKPLLDQVRDWFSLQTTMYQPF